MHNRLVLIHQDIYLLSYRHYTIVLGSCLMSELDMCGIYCSHNVLSVHMKTVTEPPAPPQHWPTY